MSNYEQAKAEQRRPGRESQDGSLDLIELTRLGSQPQVTTPSRGSSVWKTRRWPSGPTSRGAVLSSIPTTATCFKSLVAGDDTPAAWVEAGRAYECFALRATALDIRTAFIN